MIIKFEMISEFIRKKNFTYSPFWKIRKKLGINPLNVVNAEKKKAKDILNLFDFFGEK